jgi:DNA-binding CsgD family transcriptional regulator/tetratricopeptide (TPR) repeat protein
MLLEREGSLAALARALEASRAQGQIAAVSGEAGIGKTSLLAELATREGRDATFLWGACDALGTPRPLGPLLDMAPDLGSDFDALLATAAPRHHVFAAFTACVSRRTSPTAIVFEDVHWADEATLDLLRYVGRRIHRIGALIVVTWRADEVGADHPLHRLLGELPANVTHRIELQPLSLDAVTRMAGDTHDGAHARAVFARTSGNPFFVTEVLRAGGGGDAVPASVREAILARRASLSIESRHVLDLVSVVPARAELELVRASANMTSATATAALMPAVDVGLLTFDGRALAFRHELARLAVLESLPLLRVQELHRTVFAALSTSAFADRASVLARLVHHAVGAGDGEAVQRFAPAAARQAAALGAHREAAAHYRTALAWAVGLDTSKRAEIIELLAYECYLTGDIAAARDARAEALGLWSQLNVPRAIGRDLRWLSRLAWFLGDHASAKRRALEALDVLSPLGEDEELAMALSNCAQLHMLAREHEPCIRMGQRAIDMARRLGSIEALSHALNNVGSGMLGAGDLAGRQLQEEALTLALDHDLHEHAARAFTNLASCSIHARDYEYAQRWLDRGINYSAERDLDSWWLYMLAYRARLLAETGRWEEAEADATTVNISARTNVVARIPALTTLGLLRARQRRDGAATLLDEALALALPTAEKQRLLPVLAARAELALLQGRRDVARAEADAGLALLSPTDLVWDWESLRYLKWRSEGAPLVERAAGCETKAGGIETRANDATAAPPADAGIETRAIGVETRGAELKRMPADTRHACGAVCGPHSLSARGEWRAAADAWERIGCPYERAEALADGDVAAMEEALQTFVSLGAVPAADRLRKELRRAGVTRMRRGPRPSTRAHPAGLTRRESEILALLAQRLSNPAIGERLFVSPKTVEHHVSAILGKLEVATRDEAVIEARRRGWLGA